MTVNAHLIMFSVNLVFIVTSLYGWILKRFYVPVAYKENFGDLYPMARTMATMYLLQLFEMPYLFMVGRPEVLFYVNGTALLCFTSYLVILVKGYFFLDIYSIGKLLFFMHPVFIVWVMTLLPVIGVVEFTPTFKLIMTIVILLLTVRHLYSLDKLRLKVMSSVREIEEDEFSNEKDFPVKFARSIKWLPLLVVLLLIGNFVANDEIVKMVRDILFTVLNVWFAIITLNPHRNTKKLPQELKKLEEIEESAVPVKHRLSEKHCHEMEKELLDIICEKKLYLEEHLTMNDLTHIMHTNKNYLSEVIARSEYRSFYQLINTMRINHACNMLMHDPTAKLEQVAIASGFTSGSAFSQVFKRLKDVSPKEYIGRLHAE